MWDYIIKKGQELSTWVGISSILAAVGITIAPELVTAISTTLVGVFGVIAVIYNENKNK